MIIKSWQSIINTSQKAIIMLLRLPLEKLKAFPSKIIINSHLLRMNKYQNNNQKMQESQQDLRQEHKESMIHGSNKPNKH